LKKSEKPLDGEIVPTCYDGFRKEVLRMLPTKKILERLGIDRERIKYYKKMNVFHQESTRSGYYTEQDAENLRRLIVLGKAGLTCDDIKKVQDGELTLVEAINDRRMKIEEKLKRMLGSLRLSEEMLTGDIQYESMNTDYYWDVIIQREHEGEEFMDDDYYWEIDLTRTLTCPFCKTDQDVDLEDYLYDQSSDEKENGMGPDIVYSFDSDENHECPHCGKRFKVYGWIREYPMGAYDSEDIFVEPLDNKEDDKDE